MPTSRRIASAAVFALAAVLAGCPVKGDIGYPCLLVSGNPDGGPGTVPILEGNLTAGQDVISFGAIECENFICVHNRYAPFTGNPSAQAQGTCSAACTTDTVCAALYPQADPTQGRYTCRALLLDPETLAALCAANPSLCNQIWGTNRSSNFCAQGAASGPDAGS